MCNVNPKLERQSVISHAEWCADVETRNQFNFCSFPYLIANLPNIPKVSFRDESPIQCAARIRYEILFYSLFSTANPTLSAGHTSPSYYRSLQNKHFSQEQQCQHPLVCRHGSVAILDKSCLLSNVRALEMRNAQVARKCTIHK